MASAKSALVLSLGLLLAGQGLGTLAWADSKGNVFRYVDGKGRTVYGSHVPAEYVRNGYTILNAKGQVIEEVPRAKTAEEIAELERVAAQQKAAAEVKKKQEEADQLLIRLYRAPEEIERKRDNMLGPLNAQIGLLVGNIAKAQETLTEAQTVVDNYINAGKEAPTDVVARVERSRTEIEALEKRLETLEADRTRIIADAERDSTRLRQLLGSAE